MTNTPKINSIKPPTSRDAGCGVRVSKAFITGYQENSFANPVAACRDPTKDTVCRAPIIALLYIKKSFVSFDLMSLCIFDSSAMARPDSYGLSEAGVLPIIT